MLVTIKNATVKKIVYYNNKNQWGVFSISYETNDKNSNAKITVSGNFERIYEGCKLDIVAEEVEHPKYGLQLQLQNYCILKDSSSKEAIVNFLTKSSINGIHKKLANKIYTAFGSESINVVLHQTEKLKKINGIGQKTYEVISKSVAQYFLMEELLNYCTEIGLNKFTLITQIFKEFGEQAVVMLKENPYQLLTKSETLSFNQVDEIAMKSGIAADDDNRLKYGLLYVLNRESILQGSIGCLDMHLKQVFLKTLGLQNNQLYNYTLTKLNEDNEIYRDDNCVYLKTFYNAERNIATNLKLINNEIARDYDEKVIDDEIHNFPFTLNDDQIQAINSCLTHQFSVITSLAGCVDCGTKYFNGEEWIPVSKYKTDDKVLQYNADGSITLVYPSRYIKKPAQVLYHMTDTKGYVNMILSDDHRFIYKDDKNNIKEVLFKEVMHSVITHKCFNGKLITFNDDIDLNTPENNPLSIESVKPKDGMQYCFTVPSGMLVLKKDDNIFITGNCGKSTISKAVINILSRHHHTIILLAPTAKAAKRLTECTGLEAQTIHRFLKIRDNTLKSYKEVEVPINSVILIDEASMLDVRLFEKVLDVIKFDTRVILVGDTHQLPSVQAGNLLEDVIKSEKFNVCYLRDITRQAENSNIIKYSNMVNEGQVIPYELRTHDVISTSFSKDQREKVVALLKKSYAKAVEKYGLLNVQLICAYKQGLLGVHNLNNELRLAPVDLSKNEDEEIFAFRIGDKVRHTVNNYDLNVFNGETGLVVKIMSAEDIENEECEDLLVVDFGDKIVKYNKFEANDLTLSYASTVHASQGSEYDCVYIVIDNEISNILLVRKIIYTAITRAKKKCYILNIGGCVNTAILNNHYKERITKLQDFIKGE